MDEAALLAVQRLVSDQIDQINVPFNQREAQRGMRSYIDAIDLGHTGEIDIRAWVRTYEESGKPIYVGIYTTFRDEGRGYISVGFPLPSANITVTLLPFNEGDDLVLTTKTKLPYPGHYISAVDRERDQLTSLKLLQFGERIHVYVRDGELATDHRFYLAGIQFLNLHYTMERV